MTAPQQPDVRPDPDSQPFWDACQRRELLGQKCGRCGAWRWPPREHCPRCHAADPVWQRLEGTGVIVGHVVVRRVMDPAFADRTPLPIVHVRLDGTGGEMVLTSNLLPGQWPQAAPGLPVAVRFVRGRGDRILPHFTIDYARAPASGRDHHHQRPTSRSPQVPDVIAPESADRIFRQARSFNAWTDRPVARQTLAELYELMKFGPTSSNTNPLRIVFVTSPEGRERLARSMLARNGDKVRAAPVTAILGYDTRFFEHLGALFPHDPERAKMFTANPALAEETAFRNSSLQAGYFIIAARAVGLDCGPMSGFRADAVNRDFFPDGRIKTNLVCALGYGDASRDLWARLPRPPFDEACSFA